MADPPSPLSSLLEPPLGSPPSMGDLQQRVRRIQRRRWAVRGTGATAVLVAMVAGTLALTGGEPRTTVRTASPASGPAQSTASQSPVAAQSGKVVLDTFEAGGKTWELIGYAESGGVCLLLQSGQELANGLCWPDTSKLAVISADPAGTTYMYGIAAPEVTLLSYGPNRPDDLVPFVGPSPSPFGVKVFGRVMPAGLASITLTAATATDPNAYSQPVTLHGRASTVNNSAAAAPNTHASTGDPNVTLPIRLGETAPVPTTTVVRGETPPSPPSSLPTTPTTHVPSPPLTGQPKSVQPNPGATNLRPTRFESATGTDTSAIAVRFWGGNENCDVLGRVDVEETSTTVTIRLWTGWPPGYSGGPCTAEALLKEVLVSLSSPLAGRTIVDGNA
jgi:hypothetical protein